MRIWDIAPGKLCRQHLLGEHRELHAVWSILTGNKKGYARHPETLRWKGKQKALFNRHQLLVREMERRGYRHQSPLDPVLAVGREKQDRFLHTKARQRKILAAKKCGCGIGPKDARTAKKVAGGRE